MSRRVTLGRTGLFVLVAALLCALSSLVVVGENQQVVITRLGQPVRVVNRFSLTPGDSAGLVLKLPFIEQAVRFERGLQGHTLAGLRIDTKDGMGLLVDADITYRIIDPVRLVNRVGSIDKLESTIDSALPAMLTERLGQLSAETIALPGSGGQAQILRAAADAKSRDYGIQIVDLRIGRIVLSEASLKSAIGRMQDRHLGEVADIELASSQESRQVRADVDAESARIMQESAGKDPEFYGYFRALRSYDIAMYQPDGGNPKTIVIPPDSAYLRYFNGR